MLFNPPAETEISAGDYLIVMGATPNLWELEKLVAVQGCTLERRCRYFQLHLAFVHRAVC